jgi:hypothetical protein
MALLNNDPVPTSVADRWRITFSEEVPRGFWRDEFLAKAQATLEGRALRLSFEGITLEFNCPYYEDRQRLEAALRSRHRLINELLKATKPSKAPDQ